MESVATHLREQALKREDQHSRDVFGRSAFNRYYYATFLIVREALGAMDPKWGTGSVSHAAIPDLLRGTVKTTLKKGYQRALKVDCTVAGQCSHAITATIELAKMIEEARFARTTADYETDVPVQFAGVEAFSLNSVSVLTAKAWPSKAKNFLGTIKAAWRQINA